MKLVFLIAFLFFISPVFSQNSDALLSSEAGTEPNIKVDVEASVDEKEWVVHLTNELEPVIKKAAKKGLQAGVYTVRVRFLVEKDGSINYVQALNDPGYDLAKAAEKGVQTGPRWKPGEHNGKKVRSFQTQPIRFVIQYGRS